MTVQIAALAPPFEAEGIRSGGSRAQADRARRLPRLVGRPLLLPARLHVRLSDRAARVRPARGGVRRGGRAARRRQHRQLLEPQGVVRVAPAARRGGLSGHRRYGPPARGGLRRPARRRLGAPRDVRHRPRRRRPTREHHRPERRPEPGRDTPRPPGASYRRALPGQLAQGPADAQGRVKRKTRARRTAAAPLAIASCGSPG